MVLRASPRSVAKCDRNRSTSADGGSADDADLDDRLAMTIHVTRDSIAPRPAFHQKFDIRGAGCIISGAMVKGVAEPVETEIGPAARIRSIEKRTVITWLRHQMRAARQQPLELSASACE